MINSLSLKFRLVRAGGHLLCSLLAAAVVSLLVFCVWYPSPFRTLSGGLHLFAILVLVDVTLGPLGTAVVSRPGKSIREWRMDVMLIVLLQLGAMGYGLWTLYQARPVYMVYEIDRYRVVHAVDVVEDMLKMAPDEFKQLPRLGPGLVAVRPFKNANESADATMAALQGVELGFRPDLWMPYDRAHDALRAALKPLTKLLAAHPSIGEQARQQLNEHGLLLEKAAYLPVHSRTAFWTAVVDTDSLKPVFYLNFDPY